MEVIDNIIEPPNDNGANWDLLVDDIYNKKCVLLLGPSLNFFKKRNRHISLYDQLMRFMLVELRKKKVQYDFEQRNNILYLIDSYIEKCLDASSGKKAFIKSLSDFFEQAPIPDLYKKIAAFPFHTIVNTSPDQIINRTAHESGFQYDADTYNYGLQESSLQGALQKPTSDNSVYQGVKLIYNLCGSLKDGPRNLVLNERDQITYLKTYIANGPPPTVLGRLDSEKSYIFLDFDFDDWQFRLVMDILLKNVQSANIVYAPKTQKGVTKASVRYYERRFNLQYLPMQTADFIAELTRRYTAKYGAPDRKFKTFIAYDNTDKTHADDLMGYIKLFNINKRLELLPMKVGITEELSDIEKRFNEAEVYIPLISGTYAGSAQWMDQLKRAVQLAKTREKKIFPIFVGGGLKYQEILPDLSGIVLLPYNEKAIITLASVLKTHDGDKDKVYSDIITILNSEIK